MMPSQKNFAFLHLAGVTLAGPALPGVAITRRQNANLRRDLLLAWGLSSVLLLSGVSTARAETIGSDLALTIYLPMRNRAAAEQAAIAVQTPGDPAYHQFLSASSFLSQYGPTDRDVAAVEAKLQEVGFTISYVYPNHLAVEATSSSSNAQAVFGLSLRTVTIGGRTGTISATVPHIPASLAGIIRGVAGYDSFQHPVAQHATSLLRSAAIEPDTTKIHPSGPGNLLPADFMQRYDVAPLRQSGLDGSGVTIGILTENTFRPEDAYNFWQQIGLHVSPTRIKLINVDDGETTTLNNLDGESETDLDVEQSGSIAPGANIRVYIAPNINDAPWVNEFEAAASENIADVISTSWGSSEAEYFYNRAAHTPGATFLLDAFHDALLEMALQGQTVFASAGDSGSFDTVLDFEYGCPAFGTPSATSPICNAPYAVEFPSSDPLVTAAGGTTLPFAGAIPNGPAFKVTKEQAWGDDWIIKQEDADGFPEYIPTAEVFPVGGGGGVSSFFKKPAYQDAVPGMTRTKPNQVLTEDFGAGPITEYALRSNFAGRNTPDLSADADPQTGYQLLQRNQVYDYNGGTSFVAPQFAGAAALFVQSLGHRIGQLNPALYRLGSSGSTDIATFDKWGNRAHAGFDNATGLGVLDGAKLLDGLKSLEPALTK
jgi:subtilase family serine protease